MVSKDTLSDLYNARVFCDMAFIDKEWQDNMLKENNVEIITPIKRTKTKKQLSFWDKIYSYSVSSIKQSIESFNNWIIEKTNIQKASKVRSNNGLISFIFARIACACFCFGFNS